LAFNKNNLFNDNEHVKLSGMFFCISRNSSNWQTYCATAWSRIWTSK